MSQQQKQPKQSRGGPAFGGMGAPVAKAKDFRGTLRKFMRELGTIKAQGVLVIVFILAVVSTVFTIFGPRITGRATTEIFEGIMRKFAGTGGIDFDKILYLLLTMLGLYLISLAMQTSQGWMMARLSTRLTYRWRAQIADKINRLPLAYFDRTTQGEVLSRMTNDIDTVTLNLNQNLTQIISSVVSIIGVLIMMLTISGWMTLVAVVSLPVTFILVMGIVKKSQPLFIAQQEYLGHINGHVEEQYGGHVVVKAFSREDASCEKFDEYNQTLYKSAWKSQFYSGLMMPISRFVGNLSYVAVCILGGVLAVRGSIALGDIVSFVQYIQSFTQPIQSLANISNTLQSTMAAAERVFEFLGEDEEAPDPKPAYDMQVVGHDDQGMAITGADAITGAVSFRHVRFGYDAATPVIRDFSLEVAPGSIVAIVGPTGAGKTTIVKLLMRYYDIDDGAILIDGQDIKSFSRNGLRGLFGMVLQDTWLFSGSIRENIRYGRLGATDEQVKEAAKAAQAHQFIRALPDGYDMQLNEEGTNISQGQKQLLTIARAILSQPKLLILDEATSSVDTRTEVAIQKAMANLMQGRTCFVIAHRLSTIRDADTILVLRDGDIVETGNHAALMAQGGFYRELYQSQFENEQE